MDEAQFDRFTKAISTRLASRRLVAMGALAGLLTGPPAFDSLIVDAANRPRGGGGKGKGHKPGKKKKRPNKPNKPNKPKPPPTSCSAGACAAEPEWTGRPGQIDYCEFICRQCDGDDPREFCIIDFEYPDGTTTKGAVCCPEGESCRDASCCVICTGGTECVETEIDDRHCGGCGRKCDIGLVCRDSNCQNGLCNDDPDCPEGKPCINGECTCGSYNYCFNRHLGKWVCYSGNCSDLA